MAPYLYLFPGVALPTFGLCLSLAFIIGLFWSRQRALVMQVDPGKITEALAWIMLASILGARLMYLCFFSQQFLLHPWAMVFASGGLVWYGGLIGGLLALWGYCKRHGLSTLTLTNLMAPPVSLGLAIGRMGCFLAGCCYGGPCSLPWAIHYPLSHETHGLAVHPSPLYESFALLVVTLLLLGVEARALSQNRHPALLAWFLILYGMIRFALEYCRGDRLIWLPGLDLSASQCISILGSLLGVWLLFYAKNTNRMVGFNVNGETV